MSTINYLTNTGKLDKLDKAFEKLKQNNKLIYLLQGNIECYKCIYI